MDMTENADWINWISLRLYGSIPCYAMSELTYLMACAIQQSTQNYHSCLFNFLVMTEIKHPQRTYERWLANLRSYPTTRSRQLCPYHIIPGCLVHITQKGLKSIQEPCYRRQNRVMLLKISIRIEFYNGIMRFLCHSTAFLYTSVTVQMLKLHTVRWFSRPWRKIMAIRKSRHTTKIAVKAMVIVNTTQ